MVRSKMQPQFDAKLTSDDGKMYLFIRGPFEVDGGLGFELKMVPVVVISKWALIWKSEEVGGEANTRTQ